MSQINIILKGQRTSVIFCFSIKLTFLVLLTLVSAGFIYPAVKRFFKLLCLLISTQLMILGFKSSGVMLCCQLKLYFFDLMDKLPDSSFQSLFPLLTHYLNTSQLDVLYFELDSIFMGSWNFRQNPSLGFPLTFLRGNISPTLFPGKCD